jgi:hypothetical protein
MIGSYLLNIAIAFDQLLNAFLFGSPDETLSSRAYRAEQNNKRFGLVFRPLIDCLFFWQDKHCYQSYISEVKKRQLPLHFSLL